MKLNRRKFLRSSAIASGLIWVPDRRILAAPPTAFNAVNPPPSSGPTPVARWKFNEGSGATAHDSSGNGWTMAGTNSPTWGTATIGGVANTSYTSCAGGSSQYWSTSGPITQIESASSATLMGWLTSISGSVALFGPAITNYAFYIYWSSASGYASIDNGTANNYYQYNGGVDLTWYHVAMVFNAGSVTFYVNGASQTSSGSSGTIPSTLPSSSNMPVCYAGYNPINLYRSGSYADCQIFSSALTGAQITTIYNAGPV